jgi:methylthioribulose-1-phosphate dehydratase
MAAPDKRALKAQLDQLCATARWCYERGWVPATSGNFSVRTAKGKRERIYITPSGLDKGQLKSAHLLEIDSKGKPAGSKKKPSAETVLHLALYKQRPQAHAILHVHTVWNNLLSGHFAGRPHVPITGYEILKGLSEVKTHEHEELVPLIANTQDYAALERDFNAALNEYPHAHGVLLARHGFYTWGQSVAEARRHLEALEFLFEIEARRVMGGSA